MSYKTRPAPNAPIAAPQDPQSFFPSPRSDTDHVPRGMPDHSPEYSARFPPIQHQQQEPTVFQYIRQELSHRAHEALQDYPNSPKREAVDIQTDRFKQEIAREIDRWRDSFLVGIGEVPTKRPLDDPNDPSGLGSPPGPKKLRPDSDDEEEGEGKKNGGWRCLYYEHDPRKYAQCDEKRYKRVSELRRHIKTHTLPHYCSICGYRTAEERRLANHKCEEANKKRYAPVTEEDKRKHEQLARMAVKVGQMREILFGSEKTESGDLSMTDDGSSANEQPIAQDVFPGYELPEGSPPLAAGPMPPGSSPLGGPLLQGAVHPYSQGPAGMPILPSTTIPLPSSTSYALPTTSGPAMVYAPPVSQAPFTMTGIAHSPIGGHAGSYYNSGSDVDFTLYPQGATSPPHFPPNETSMTIKPEQQQVYPSPGPNYTYGAPPNMPHHQPQQQSQSSDTYQFLQELFPNIPETRARSMPLSEIKKMEANLRRRVTSLFVGENERSKKLSTRIRDGSKKMFRSFSMGAKRPKELAEAQDETAAAAQGSDEPAPPRRSASWWKKLSNTNKQDGTRAATASARGETPDAGRQSVLGIFQMRRRTR